MPAGDAPARPILAAHSSRCLICEGTVEEGDKIVQVDGEYVHATCAEEEGFAVDWTEPEGDD